MSRVIRRRWLGTSHPCWRLAITSRKHTYSICSRRRFISKRWCCWHVDRFHVVQSCGGVRSAFPTGLDFWHFAPGQKLPIEFKNETRSESATAAVVLGGGDIFGWPVRGRSRVAASFVVGHRIGSLCLCGGVFSFAASLAWESACLGSAVSPGRFSDSGSWAAIGGSTAGWGAGRCVIRWPDRHAYGESGSRGICAGGGATVDS